MDIKHLPLYFHMNAELSATGEKLLPFESSFHLSVQRSACSVHFQIPVSLTSNASDSSCLRRKQLPKQSFLKLSKHVGKQNLSPRSSKFMKSY